MKTEVNFFAGIGIFFAAVAAWYGLWTDWSEPVGWVTLFLSAGMGLMIAFFLWNTARKLPARPDDDEDGEIEMAEGPLRCLRPVLLVAAVALALGLDHLPRRGRGPVGCRLRRHPRRLGRLRLGLRVLQG